MTVEEAGVAVAYLNAAFPRDALEPESFQVWVTEVASLAHAGSGLEAARMIGRNGDRFPTIKEYRQAYRQAFDRFMAGREIEAPDDSVPPPPEAVEMLARMEAGTVLRSIDDLPVSTAFPPRPVWARWLRRKILTSAADDPSIALSPPTDAEKHDAIAVLAAEGWGIDGMHSEAQRIMDEAWAQHERHVQVVRRDDALGGATDHGRVLVTRWITVPNPDGWIE